MTSRTPRWLRAGLALALVSGACMPASSDGGGPDPERTGGSRGVMATGGMGGAGQGGAGSPGTGGNPGTGGASTAGTGGTGGSASSAGAGGGGQSGSAGGSSGEGGTSSPGGTGGTPTPSDASGEAPSAGGPVTDPGTEGDGNITMNGPYNPPPEATLQPGVTAGKLMDVAVTAKVFPGANRTVQVYIPAGYVERTPAPFMVLQDGPSYVTRFKLPTVLDNMIASKQLPQMLAIFVPNAGGRRSVEYDTLSDAYVRFVLEDVLPAVEAGAPVKLTTDPEGRSAGGHSSGGIAAFTMGWERPDQFRRILTHSGSFVSIRGGDKYPGIVKAMPVKPLRVFMSVGTKDNEAPRWQRGNENLAVAFKEKAYHYRLVIQNDGTHAQTYPASILPESLLWLWRGYPIAGK